MARMKTKEPVTSAPPLSLVASAARIRGGTSMGTLPFRNTSADSWHTEAWLRYRTIGEFRYACDWIGAQLSKAILYGTVETQEGVQKITEGGVVDYLGQLFGNADGRAEMLRLIGIHMAVTGECWIVAYPDTDPFGDGGDKWEVAASTKCLRPATDGGKWRVNDVEIDADPKDVMAIRIWRPDPLEPQLSISPARAVLSTLRELHKLSQHVSAQVDSRLAGAGILLMPSTMSFPAPAVEGPQAEGAVPVQRSASSAEDLMHVIMQAMAKSIQNRDDASALVPIVITASADDIEAVKHMTFWSDLDQHAIELRAEAIKRLALGMDMPAEVLQGAADANHWSAWQADESAIKAHTEPLLKIITTALGSHYLRPLLKGDPEFDAERLSAYSVAADTSEMRLRPNRGKEAMELFNLGELSGETLRRETGFDENDKPTKEEMVEWLTRKVAGGSTTPEMVEAALREIGVVLNVVHDTQAPESVRETIDGPAPTQATPPPSLKDLPVQDIPDRALGESRKIARQEGRVPSADIARKASLLAASDMLVLRALERAGNRLKNKLGGLKLNCAASEMYQYVGVEDVDFALTDAWSYVPAVAERHGYTAEELTAELQEYTAGLLRTQMAHSYDRLEAFMTRELESAA